MIIVTYNQVYKVNNEESVSSSREVPKSTQLKKVPKKAKQVNFSNFKRTNPNLELNFNVKWVSLKK